MRRVVLRPGEAPPGPGTLPVMPTLARADNVAFVDRDDEVVLALLPSGPIRILQGPTVLVWELAGDGPVEHEALVQQVLATFEDVPPDAAQQLSLAIDQLVGEGFLTA